MAEKQQIKWVNAHAARERINSLLMKGEEAVLTEEEKEELNRALQMMEIISKRVYDIMEKQDFALNAKEPKVLPTPLR